MTANAIATLLPKWVKTSKYVEISGFSSEALKKKRLSGIWIEGVHWKTGPDKNVYYNWREIDGWVENGYKQAANGH
ncbi:MULTISPECIES: excisionase family protein [unclassified Neptuniibacter]|uniref:excisionase family protein n=1 Tax=unclassified Neptuniibacter TaxID=2630693 RepID=UPI000C41EE4F|nr:MULTISPECIES: excisionase family protein [unclassified Neptuniibacter]MAY41716.1 excisionase [Oceanospirillaceae bacterium]|tara:strand:+ start:2500 stop:2727 length:228 start_codon:yes stop_codon:yes gene_type:complete